MSGTVFKKKWYFMDDDDDSNDNDNDSDNNDAVRDDADRDDNTAAKVCTVHPSAKEQSAE